MWSTWVIVELGVQVLLFGVELVVDAVHCSHQSERSHRGSDEQTYFGIIFVSMCVYGGTNIWQRPAEYEFQKSWKKNPTCLYKFFLTVSMWNIFDILAQAAFLRLVLCRMGRNRLTCLLWIKVSCFFFSQKVLCVCRRRRSCRGLMDVDLLLRLQGALRAAQWKYQQQAQSCQTRHVAHPVVRL